MSLIIRSITNASSTKSMNLFVPGYDDNNPVVIAPSATLDLLSVMSSETLHAMQKELTDLFNEGSITIAASMDSANLWPAAMLGFIAASDTQIIFDPTTASAAHAVGAIIQIKVENASGAVDIFDSSTTVVVTATGTHTPLLNGHASPLTVTVTNGVASVLVTDNLADSVGLSLSAPSRTLDVTSTCTITLS